jgi:hypothetical protein
MRIACEFDVLHHAFPPGLKPISICVAVGTAEVAPYRLLLARMIDAGSSEEREETGSSLRSE